MSDAESPDVRLRHVRAGVPFGKARMAGTMEYSSKADPFANPPETWQRLGDVVADLTRARLGRQVRHLHRLGERSLLELLIEFVGTDDNLMFDLRVLLDRYAKLTPEMIDQLDAREIRNDLIVVEGGRR